MKFKDVLSEGSWAQPNTLKKAKQLVRILKKPLLKKDASKLYDLVGDDDFNDSLCDAIRDEDENQDIGTYTKNWVKSEWLNQLDSKGWSKDWDPNAIVYLKKNL